jgi:hypothetical protein
VVGVSETGFAGDSVGVIAAREPDSEGTTSSRISSIDGDGAGFGVPERGARRFFDFCCCEASR